MNKYNKNLLNKTIENYVDVEISNLKYNKNFLDLFLNYYKYYGFNEFLYCCHGLEHSCWTEIVQNGVWNYTFEKIIIQMKHILQKNKKYLYNDKERIVLLKGKNDSKYIYFYLRDKIKKDYIFWFTNVDDGLMWL